MINLSYITALELYQNSEVLTNIASTYTTGTVDASNYKIYFDGIPYQDDLEITFTPNNTQQSIKGFKFNEIIQYTTQGNDYTTIGVVDIGDYYIYDYVFCFFFGETLYTYSANINFVNYSELYKNERFNAFQVKSLSPSSVMLNSKSVKYFPYENNPSNYENQILPNTLFNCYNYTQDGTSFISALQGKQTITYVSNNYGIFTYSGVVQKNLYFYYYANQIQNARLTIPNADTQFINTTLNFTFQTNITCPSSQSQFSYYITRPKIIPIGISKTNINKLLNIIQNSQNITNATTLIDATLNQTNNLNLVPFISTTALAFGLIGFGLFKLIKGLFL